MLLILVVSIKLIYYLVLVAFGSISLILFLIMALKNWIHFFEVSGDILFETNLGFEFEFENLVWIFGTPDLVLEIIRFIAWTFVCICLGIFGLNPLECNLDWP